MARDKNRPDLHRRSKENDEKHSNGNEQRTIAPERLRSDSNRPEMEQI